MSAFAGTIAREGRFFAPIGDARVSAVDVRDIAAVAAALSELGHEGKTHTITGPAAITHADIATAISAAIGRDVAFVHVPPEAFRAALEGVPDARDGDPAISLRRPASASTQPIAVPVRARPRTL